MNTFTAAIGDDALILIFQFLYDSSNYHKLFYDHLHAVNSSWQRVIVTKLFKMFTIISHKSVEFNTQVLNSFTSNLKMVLARDQLQEEVRFEGFNLSYCSPQLVDVIAGDEFLKEGITCMCLRFCKMTEEQFRKYVIPLKQLKELDLSSCTSLPESCFIGLYKHFPNLSTLKLDSLISIFQERKKKVIIKERDKVRGGWVSREMESAEFEDPTIMEKVFRNLGQQLRRLDFCNNNMLIRERSWKSIAHLKKLTYLDVSFSQLSNDIMIKYVIPNMPNLTTLLVGGCSDLTMEFLEVLALSPLGPKIEKLSVHLNVLYGQHDKLREVLAHMKALSRLDISWTRFVSGFKESTTEELFTVLADAKKLKTLTFSMVSSAAYIDSPIAKMLFKFMYLDRLELERFQYPEILQELRQALPRTKVVVI